MKISLVAMAVAFLVARTLADDQATSLAARTAVEANQKTREGKAYDEKLGQEFMEKHRSTMKQCAHGAGNNLASILRRWAEVGIG